MRKLQFIALTLLLGTFLHAQIKVDWPEVNKQNKPWTRWWWMGGAVNETDLTRVMELYQKAGLGGLEITDIYGVKGEEDKFINYLSPRWIEVFQHTLNEAGRLNLGIDLANASGWPFGGPWVTPEDACKTLEVKTYNLTEGESLEEPVEFIQKPMIRVAGPNKPTWDELKYPIALTPDLQGKALDQVRFERKIPLVALMGYSDTGETIDLISKLGNDGKLNWTAPKGNWTLYALFQGWHGKMVERAGPGGEGDVIDHFSRKATEDYLSYFDQQLKGADLTNLRGYFNDSYEVDDARGESNWTPDFLNEFQRRRGYDLKQFLPALFGKMGADTCNRVVCDYRETLSDLLLENYTKEWHKWANQQGKIIRNQAHGSPANILDLYAATDIPEIEGEDIPSIKFASSAAHVTGKQLTSSESATWLNQHFKSNLGDVKHALDLLMLGGVNHMFYHGTCYSPESAEWPGWLFYAAVHFNPNNTFWDDFPALNDYVTRCQSFLQKGKPDNDILLYFPIYDQWSKPGRSSLVHFNGYRRLPEDWSVKLMAEEMTEKGYAYDYISDQQISNLQVEAGKLLSNGNEYKVILVPKTSYMPVKTLNNLVRLANEGAIILFQDQIPGFSGFGNMQQMKDGYHYLLEGITYADSRADSTRIANIGHGRWVIGSNLLQLMNAADVKSETMVDDQLQCIRRKLDTSEFYFITNHGNVPVQKVITLSRSFRNIAFYDPMTGRNGVGSVSNKTKTGTEVFIVIDPGETILLQGSDEPIQGNNWQFYKTGEKSKDIKGKWDITFVKGGPEIPEPIKTRKLISWTDFEKDQFKNFSGTAKYEIEFKNPGLKSDMVELDLGTVHESARVYLNDSLLATVIGPEFKLQFNNQLLESKNKLVIEVSNSMANRIAYMDKNGIEWRKFYNTNFQTQVAEDRGEDGLFTAKNWEPVSSGLIGPVVISELEVRGNK